jgi:hypothetical protein
MRQTSRRLLQGGLKALCKLTTISISQGSQETWLDNDPEDIDGLIRQDGGREL